MCRPATIRAVTAASFLWALQGLAWGQAPALDWRHIGNSAIELALPSVATGAVDRVWYSQDGSTLYARTASGRMFQTSDFEGWHPVTDPKILPPAQENPSAVRLPETSLKVSGQALGSNRYYGVGRQAYRSDDGGLSWANLTAYQGASILGDGLSDVAISPHDQDEVVVASLHGIWRSLDGGLSWTGLNEFLPNLPSGRLLGIPNGTRGLQLSLGGTRFAIEWAPGEKTAWRPVESRDFEREQDIKTALSQIVNRSVTAFTPVREYIYLGDSEGRLQASSDAGVSWGTLFRVGDAGPVQAIWADPADPRVAIAVLQGRNAAGPNQVKSPLVLRTMNGGVFWDDITANLPESAAAHGVAADRASGAIYVATDAGVFYTITDLASAGSATSWISLGNNLPAAAATDVKLDASANQIYVALDGYGVYAAIAPHRLRAARLVSAADYSARPAAPGALLSVLGARVESARSDNTVVPVLDASASASQIQVPFDAKGNTFSLSVDGTAGRLNFGLPLQSVSPALVIDPEGTPLIMDAASGVLLDATKPARPNTRIQILATGFGRVAPDWPTGLAAPLSDSPRVLAPVRAYLDGAPVEVTLASLAPGYVGFYLIEIQLPRIVNAGPAELFLEAEGQQTNRVRLYLEP
jgi:uncharacterized protein (TIGR03437 family)